MENFLAHTGGLSSIALRASPRLIVPLILLIRASELVLLQRRSRWDRIPTILYSFHAFPMAALILRLTLICFVLSWTYVSAEVFSFPEKLPEHPRLFFTKQKGADVKELMKTDAFLEKLVSELIQKADRVKTEPPSKYEIPDGKRLLAQSRRSIDRTTALAFAYRMTGNKEYADAAITEMLTVCRFQDWNPSHYLDTAEMATAVALGYDWLYDVIPAEQREEIKNALVKHALQTGKELYEKNGWWVTAHNNWNEVCNAGLTLAALAVADDEPTLAESIVNSALKSFPTGLSAYKPDGAYPEGPSYWAYGASFTGLMLMVLQDVFQKDFDLLKTEGLNVTGDYYMGVIGPNYRSFNYADSGSGADSSPMMFALSHMYDRLDYAVWLRTFLETQNRYQSGRLAVFHALWYNPKGTDEDFAKTPLAQKYSGIQDVCTMRTAWNDPNAAFLGFKGGYNRANHGHLDIGSFVYEVNGVRWAVDLGGDDYNMPGYFGAQRWNYFRLNNRSHNTLVIGDKLQNVDADCKIHFVGSGAKLGFGPSTSHVLLDHNTVASVMVDMKDAYKGQAPVALRYATLYKDGSVEIEDFLNGVTEPVRWGMMTQATIELDGESAILSQRDQKVRVELVSDYAEKFEITSAKPPTEAENQNAGFSMLTATATPKEGGHGQVSIRVVIRPL